MKQLFFVKGLFIAIGFFVFSCEKGETPEESTTLLTNSKMNENNASIKGVPIKSTYVTTSEILSGPPMVLNRITGVGQSSHLGEGTFVALSTLNLTTPPPFQISGTATFWAANGDAIYTEFAGTATPNPDGTRTVVMTHTITGGTGRFENATGSFVGNTIADPTAASGFITSEGYINYN